jgi:hypothetical protein
VIFRGGDGEEGEREGGREGGRATNNMTGNQPKGEKTNNYHEKMPTAMFYMCFAHWC